MRREYNIDLHVGNPQVNYRETISQKAAFNYLHKKQTGGSGQYAKIMGYIEPTCEDPTEPDADVDNFFEDKTQGMNIPNEYIPAIEKAFHEQTKRGP